MRTIPIIITLAGELYVFQGGNKYGFMLTGTWIMMSLLRRLSLWSVRNTKSKSNMMHTTAVLSAIRFLWNSG